MLLEHVESCLGAAGVDAVLAAAGQSPRHDDLLDDSSWSSYEQFRRLLEAAAEALGGVDQLERLTVNLSGGSMPETTAMLQAFGSPTKMFAAMSDGQSGLSTIMDGHAEEVGPAVWRLQHALIEGFEPFPELCAFMTGIAPLGVQLFGMSVSSTAHETCQLRGDQWCSDVVAWDETEDLTNQLAFTRTSLELARNSLDSFQATVADLVSTDDLETVLTRIVATAARATRAPAFVLALEPMPGVTRRVYAEGLDDADAAEIAARVLSGDVDGLGLVVEVGSTRRHYGTLVAVDRAGIVLAPEEQTLQAFARLAATALDSACALDDARRESTASRALLELSMALAEVTTPEELAVKVAHVMPAVIDSDRALVVLVDDGFGRVAAHHGFDDATGRTLDAMRFPCSDQQENVLLHTLEHPHDDFGLAFLESAGLVAMATAPIIIESQQVGFLVAAVTEGAARIVDDEHLAERFGGLAAQTSVALRNGRLLEHIRYQALHDPLTGLPNRALIVDRADQMLARARRDRHATAAMFIDLDGFKEINDTLGHAAGDALLRCIAERLRTTLRGSDTVGRLGGDEFVVFCEAASLDAGPEIIADRLLEVIALPVQVPGRDTPVSVTASIGIALGERATAGELLRDADIALYSAKGAGKSCFRIYAPEMQAQLADRAQLSEGLNDALASEQYFLVYQPIIDLQGEVVTGVEALLRWQHPTRGVIAPDAFIPHLEESGMIVEVGRWVLQEACRQTAAWHASGHRIDISVNASVRQLERPEFVGHVREALEESGLPPSSLIVEITETAIMRDAEATTAVLTSLKALGVRIAIDDFGTGYSSLAYLRQFPVDALKIDRSFISSIADSVAAGEIIRSLVGLGKALHLETLAEGIEERAQFDRLQLEGCDSGQGYMFSRPLDAVVLTAFLDENHLATPVIVVTRT